MSLLFNKLLLAVVATVVSTLLLVNLLCSSPIADAARPASAWKGRRIYQILTDRFAYANNANSSSHCGPQGTGACNMNLYNGGTFQGIIDHLPYITGMGFDAIWISPVPKQFSQLYQGKYASYHGYWATDFSNNVDNVNPHFGTPAELHALIAACKKADVWIMIDIVLNHAGPIGTNYGLVTPFNESQYYHPECNVDVYQCDNQNTLKCRLAGLADLDQDNSFVSSTLFDYVKYVTNLFDGIRADTVMYINRNFWKQATDLSGTIVTGEVYSSWSCQTEYINAGAITSSLNYALFYVLQNVYLQKGSMRQLGAQWRAVKALPNPNLETLFVDNHDNSRWLSLNGATIANLHSSVAHIFFQLGIPIVYYGTEQYYKGEISDNTNRYPLWTSGFNTSSPMYIWLGRANAAYKQFGLAEVEPFELWQDDNMYCYSRGPVLLCTSNTEGQSQTRNIPNLPFGPGQTICDWLNPEAQCQQGGKQMDITVPSSGMPILLYAKTN